MRYKIGIVMGAALIFMTIAGTAFGWGDRGHGGKCDRDDKGRIEAMAKELNLTPDQETRLKEIKEAHRAQAKKSHLTLKEKYQALRDELSKPGVTRQAVEPIVAEINRLEAGMTKQRIEGIFEVKEIMTPEQFAKLQANKGAKHYKGFKMRRYWKGR